MGNDRLSQSRSRSASGDDAEEPSLTEVNAIDFEQQPVVYAELPSVTDVNPKIDIGEPSVRYPQLPEDAAEPEPVAKPEPAAKPVQAPEPDQATDPDQAADPVQGPDQAA